MTAPNKLKTYKNFGKQVNLSVW